MYEHAMHSCMVIIIIITVTVTITILLSYLLFFNHDRCEKIEITFNCRVASWHPSDCH